MRTIETTCCFTGHRPEKLPWRYDETDAGCVSLRHRIGTSVENVYGQGYRYFLCGMAQGCDFLFCEEVLALRERCPDVFLEAAIPCPSQADTWSAAQRERYRRLTDACNLRTLVSQRYTPDCLLRRNRYMVDRSSLLISVYGGVPGGSQYTVAYAMRHGLQILSVPVLEPDR